MVVTHKILSLRSSNHMNSIVLEHSISCILHKIYNDTVSLVSNGKDFHSLFQYFHYSVNHKLQTISSQHLLSTFNLFLEKERSSIFYMFEIKLERVFFTSRDVFSLLSFQNTLLDILIHLIFPINLFESIKQVKDSIFFFYFLELDPNNTSQFIWNYLCYVPLQYKTPIVVENGNNLQFKNNYFRYKQEFFDSVKKKLQKKEGAYLIPLIYSETNMVMKITELLVGNTLSETKQVQFILYALYILSTNQVEFFEWSFKKSCLAVDNLVLKKVKESLKKEKVVNSFCLKENQSLLQTKYELSNKNEITVIQWCEIYYNSLYSQVRTYILNPTYDQLQIIDYLIELRNWIAFHLYKYNTFEKAIDSIFEKIRTDKREILLNYLNPNIIIPCFVTAPLLFNSMSMSLIQNTMFEKRVKQEYLNNNYNPRDCLIHLCYTTKEYSIAICDVYSYLKKSVTTKLHTTCDYVFPCTVLSSPLQNNKGRKLTQLPKEVIISIGQFLEIQDFVSYFMICKQFNEWFCVEKNSVQQMIWKEFVIHYFFDNSVANSYNFKLCYGISADIQEDKEAIFAFERVSVLKWMNQMTEMDWRLFFISKYILISNFQHCDTIRALIFGYGDTSESIVFAKFLHQFTNNSSSKLLNLFKYNNNSSNITYNKNLFGLKNGCEIDLKTQNKRIVMLQMRKPLFNAAEYYDSKIHIMIYALDITNFEQDYKKIYRNFHDVMCQLMTTHVTVFVVILNVSKATKYSDYDCRTLQFNTQSSKIIDAKTTVSQVLQLNRMGHCGFYRNYIPICCFLDEFSNLFKQTIVRIKT